MQTSSRVLRTSTSKSPTTARRALAFVATVAGIMLAAVAAADDGTTYRHDLRPTAIAQVAGPGVPIDLFQSDTRFAKQSTAGSVEPDLEQALIGTRSLRVSTDGDAQQVNLRASGLGPLDLSQQFVRLNLKVKGLAHLDYLTLYLSGDGYETYDSFPVLVGGLNSVNTYGDEDGWFTITAGLGLTVADAPPSIDLRNVTDVQLSIKDNGTGAVTVWFDSLEAVALPQRGKVSLVFDDARDGVFDFALPLAQRLGLQASIAVIVDLVGQPSFMTVDQLRVAERFAGWEVMAHHVTPLENGGFDTLPADDLVAELAGVKTWLLDQGFQRGSEVIAYPYGGFDKASIALVREYFAAGRTIIRSHGMETWPPADPYRIRAVSVVPTDTPAVLNALIDRAAKERTWLILVFHQVYPRDSEFDTYYYTEDLASVLTHAVAADVDVVLMSDALFGR